MNILDYYSDLSELRDNLLEFAFKYSDKYSAEASKSQQKLLQFINMELELVTKEIQKNIRR